MMGPNEEWVREEMRREADILRGLGQMPSLEGYLDELSWARVADMERVKWPGPDEIEELRRWDEELREHADRVDLQEQVIAWEGEGGRVR